MKARYVTSCLGGEWREWHGLPYMSNSDQPDVLITSGLHGDELGVVSSIERLIPGLIRSQIAVAFVPVLCPEAAALGTRTDQAGRDFNRQFFTPFSPDVERVTSLTERLGPVKVLVSIHEDPDASGMYVYSEGKNLPRQLIKQWRLQLAAHGLPVFSGIDDPSDPHLILPVVDGWCRTDSRQHPTMYESWVALHDLAKTVITLEIPGQVEPAIKDAYLALTMEKLLWPLLCPDRRARRRIPAVTQTMNSHQTFIADHFSQLPSQVTQLHS